VSFPRAAEKDVPIAVAHQQIVTGLTERITQISEDIVLLSAPPSIVSFPSPPMGVFSRQDEMPGPMMM